MLFLSPQTHNAKYSEMIVLDDNSQHNISGVEVLNSS